MAHLIIQPALGGDDEHVPITGVDFADIKTNEGIPTGIRIDLQALDGRIFRLELGIKEVRAIGEWLE